MDPRMVQIFGPRFVVDDIQDLELLTDLLSIARDHLNVMFAVASYLEQVPNGARNLKPNLRDRLQNSLEHLRGHKPEVLPGLDPPAEVLTG